MSKALRVVLELSVRIITMWPKKTLPAATSVDVLPCLCVIPICADSDASVECLQSDNIYMGGTVSIKFVAVFCSKILIIKLVVGLLFLHSYNIFILC
jgi:hypothetical protein